MKELPTVTLIAYDTLDANRTSRVLTHCEKLMKFANSILYCSEKPTIPHRHDIKIVEKGRYSGAMRWELAHLASAFDTTHSLFISHDGWIMNPTRWNDEWLDYDFIGAPWPAAFGVGSSTRVGNSGFCLRSKRFAEACRLSMPFWTDQPADAFACRIMYRPFRALGLRYAPVEVAARFSWEEYIEEGECGPECSFGFHGWTAGKKKEVFERLLADPIPMQWTTSAPPSGPIRLNRPESNSSMLQVAE